MTGSDTPPGRCRVGRAGGLGMLGCGMRSPAAMAEAAAAVRQQTDRPFGMNLFVQATPNPDEATVQAAMERLAPLSPKLGLVPQRPTQWCEDFAAQFEALVALAPGGGKLHLRHLDAAQVARLRRQVAWWWAQPPPGPRRASGGRCSVCQRHRSGGHRGTFLGDFTAKPGRHPGAGAAVRGRRQHR